MESIEKKYKKLVSAGEVEQARELIRSQFESVLSRADLNRVKGEDGYVFKIMYRAEDEKDFKVFHEEETADGARDFLKAELQNVLEEGYVMELRYGPSELNK